MLHQDYTISDLINNPSFRKWVEGKASTREKKHWDEWVKKDTKNQKTALIAQQKIVGLSLEDSFDVPAPEKVWRKVSDKIEGNPGSDVQRSHKKERSLPLGIIRSGRMIHILRYAAVLFLVFLGSLGWYYYSGTDDISNGQATVGVTEESVSTDFGETKKIMLSDGSEILLNANSVLSYRINSAREEEVEVTLKGEAYFSVVSRRNSQNGSDPGVFRVHTGDGNVSVLGTKFTVSTREENTRVVLEEGEVLVSPLSIENGEQKNVVLKPNELAEYNRYSKDVHVRTVDPQIYTSWTGPVLVFDQTPVYEIIERIEHTYGVTVEVRDPELTTRRISGSVENTGLESMISVFGKTLSIPTEISEGIVFLGEKK